MDVPTITMFLLDAGSMVSSGCRSISLLRCLGDEDFLFLDFFLTPSPMTAQWSEGLIDKATRCLPVQRSLVGRTLEDGRKGGT